MSFVAEPDGFVSLAIFVSYHKVLKFFTKLKTLKLVCCAAEINLRVKCLFKPLILMGMFAFFPPKTLSIFQLQENALD